MNIHEYQAKRLLSERGVPVPRGESASTAQDAMAAAQRLGGDTWIVKAQIHAGGRQEAGGVRAAESPEAVQAAAGELLGRRLVTRQTGPKGKMVQKVLIETAGQVESELYLAVLVDRSKGRMVLFASPHGGTPFEARSGSDATGVSRLEIDIEGGLTTEAAESLAADVGLSGSLREQFGKIACATCDTFVSCDASLIEINPLAVTTDGRLLAMDAKVVLDDNALFRHAELEELRDESEEDPLELEAKRYELNFVALEGSVGCVVNGAGLALATLDILRDSGGEAANFMDVRPMATRDQVATGFEMILRNPQVRSILVNIYGGGVLRCDTIAEGIALASKRRGLTVPLIVRAAGTNSDICRNVLVGQGIPAKFFENLESAVQAAVQSAGQEAA